MQENTKNMEEFLEYEEITSKKLIEEYGGNKNKSLSIVLYRQMEKGKIPVREVVIPDAAFDMDILSGVVKFKAKSNIKNLKQFMDTRELLLLYDQLQKANEEVSCGVVIMHEDLSKNEFLGTNDILTWYTTGDNFNEKCDSLHFIIAEMDLFVVADENYDYAAIQADVARMIEENDRLEMLEEQREIDEQAQREYKENLGMEQYDDSWATKTFVPDRHAEGELEETEDGRSIFHRR